MVMEPSPAPGSAPMSHNATIAGAPANNHANSTTNTAPGPTLNPHSLGREFVRQYYTVLNQGPHFLHRFYSEDSSLIHGSLNRPGDVTEPVYGQGEINSKIMSLNFSDCHAKIRQVDSLETVGKGVVVQVTGELSNNGQPLRRFFQTFVLAPRSPTNYYVRNDIFRYQDEVFKEDEEYIEANKQESEIENNISLKQQQQQIEPLLAPVATSFEKGPLLEIAEPTVNGHSSLADDTEKLCLNNNEAIPDGSCISKQPDAEDVTEWKTSEQGDVPSPPGSQVVQEGVNLQANTSGEEGMAAAPLVSPNPVANSAPFQSGPRTYATMVSKNAALGSGPASLGNAAAAPASALQAKVPMVPLNEPLSVVTPVPAIPSAPPLEAAPVLPLMSTLTATSPAGAIPTGAPSSAVASKPPISAIHLQQGPPQPLAGQPQQQQQLLLQQQPQVTLPSPNNHLAQGLPQRDPRPPMRGPRPQQRPRNEAGPGAREATSGQGTESEGSVSGDAPTGLDDQQFGPQQMGRNEYLLRKREGPVYGDEMQVFVGNLPPDISEDILQGFFSKYGTILDIRINRTNQKQGSVRTPNYGFVTFDNPDIVKSILSQKPIYFNEHRFNVEEKRSQMPRLGMNRMGGPGMGGPMGPGRGGMNNYNHLGRGRQDMDMRDRRQDMNRRDGPPRDRGQFGGHVQSYGIDNGRRPGPGQRVPYNKQPRP